MTLPTMACRPFSLFASNSVHRFACNRIVQYAYAQASTSPGGVIKTDSPDLYLKKCEDLANKYTEHVDEAVGRWAKNNEVYFGKERDFENFPSVKYAETHPKVRLGFLPDTWFRALYPKTGVTGPYLFLFGSMTYVISKEIWVVDPHFLEFGVLGIVMTFLIKRYGSTISKLLDTDVEKTDQTRYYQPLRKLHDDLDRTVTTADEEIGKASAVTTLVKAKEESVELQLEAAYRERLQQVNRAVRRRLDYHVEQEDTRRRFLQQHMVDWVVNRVISDITPQQEQDTLTRCVSELRNIAKNEKAAATA